MLFDTRNENIYGVGISTVFEIFDHFLYQMCVFFWGGKITPHGYDQHTISCYLTQETTICIYMVWGISTFFEIFGYSMFKGERDLPIWS
jgi:hypothetical protein